MKQKIVSIEDENYKVLDELFTEGKNLFLVCDPSLKFLKINDYLTTKENIVSFSDFSPNPLYASVEKGVQCFHESGADTILAIGGGSALDVAKCIKLYANMDPSVNYLKQEIVPNDIRLIAMPTTAGTGSEATRYAVIYYNGEKQSVTSESCIPSLVIMDPSVLKTLPEYQKKATMMDALCHAVESYWSVNSTAVSKEYSRTAVQMILSAMDDYLSNTEKGNAELLEAAHIAGKAINITQTTAGHAMCYKLSSLYHIAHGHAAALCVSALLPYMMSNIEKCIDPRGEEYLNQIFNELVSAFGCSDQKELAETFHRIVFEKLELTHPVTTDQKEYATLTSSVNPVRLKNHPVQLKESDINDLYHQIVQEETEL